MLIKFAQNHFLEQIINHCTRKNNILYLMFINYKDYFFKQEVIDNILTSDRALNIMSTCLNLDPKTEVENSKI